MKSGGASPATTRAAQTPGTVVAATAQERAALLDRVKALAGTWEMKGKDGKPVTAAVFTVTSSGSAVREVMFPGSSEEMINMYYMDGPSMVMVHYCAMGNQPHLRATPADAAGDRIALKCDGVSNMTAADEEYMGALTVTFTDADHFRQSWQSFTKQTPGAPDDFDFSRKSTEK